MVFSRQWRELVGGKLHRGFPVPTTFRVWRGRASMLQVRSAFSVSATTLSMLLYRSEFRSCIPVPQRVKLPPVSTAPDRVPHISVRRLASRLPAQRFLD